MMRAIQVSATGGVEQLKPAQIPVPKISPTQVLVRNQFTGINFIDVYHRTGLYKMDLPFVPGREGAGVIEQVGDQVTGFAIGDRITYLGTQTYAELTAVDPNLAVKLPTEVDPSLLLIQGMTAISLARHAHPTKQGDVVLVHAAAGGTGLQLVQLCKHYGATVIGTTSTPQKAELAKYAGCDHVILYTQESVLERVMQITNGKGVNAVFDGVGKSTFDVSLQCLTRLGSMVSFGNASGKVDPIDITKLVPRVVKLMRPSLYEFLKSKQDFDTMAQEAMSLYKSGALKYHIHKTYTLDQVPQAHSDIEGKGTTGKLVVKIQ